MDSIESFVALALLDRLREANGDDSAATSTLLEGSVLFADISGSTALADDLCRAGPDGIDQLGQVLNRSLGCYVRAVRDTAGEIACFAGDAIVAYWPADDGDIPRTLRRAEACARLLHAASRAGIPPSSAPASAPHIGISAGRLWAARLGTQARWQLLLTGPAVRDACAAATRAPAGETVIGDAAASVRASSLPTADAATDETTLLDAERSSPGAPAPDIATQVPRRVRDYVGEGYAAWIPQRRPLYALFARIDGLDDTAPDALVRHQAAVTSLQVALRPYTEATGTLICDDKGLVFMLCFGMPHDAHADDALRAVRAGLAIQGELERLRLTCAIGVAAGSGVCMPIGGPQRQHYWAIGRFMHVAARVMQAAESGLWCTDEIADQVRRAVTLSPERPLRLKGVHAPVPVFRVREAAYAGDQATPLYGREDEQARLEQYLHAFTQGRGTVVWMVGDAGVGKSALVHALRQAAARRGIDCLSGGAGSMEIATPYAAWRPVFAALLGSPPPIASPAERRARLGHLRHPQLASLVNAVLPGFLEETPLAQGLSEQARADSTLSVLSEVIASRATSRFLLVIEDCHWMDSASWRLVRRVAVDYPQALLVLTSRPTADVQELSALRRLDHFTGMTLATLREEAIGALVEEVLQEGASNRATVDEIVALSRGNPLIAREYALLRVAQPQAAGARPPAVQPTPEEAVQRVVTSWFDALSPSEELALKAASVIGDTFSPRLVAGVYPGHQPIEAILTSLVERHLLVRAATDDDHLTFQHTLIREAIYRELTEAQRSDLHRRAADTVEREHHHDLRPHVAALAHHCLQGGRSGPAMQYADRAASDALAAGAFEEADHWLRTCVGLASRDVPGVPIADRVRWHRQIADARNGMGHIESRRAAAHQALRLAGWRRPHTSAGLLVQAGGRLLGMGLRRLFPRPLSTADAALRLDVARAFRHSAQACYFHNQLIGMICDCVSVVACASALQPSAVLVGALTELGGILSIAGLRHPGERLLRHAIAMAEAADDLAAQAHAHMVICLYYVGVGDWASAERSARRCQDLCEPMDDRVSWTNAQAVRFWMHHYRAHSAAAYDAACRLRDRAAETGNRQHRAWAFRFLALCALAKRETQDAIGHLQAALESLGETAALNERTPTLGLLALAQLTHGDVWTARATARDALGQVVHVRRPIGHATLEGYSALVTVVLDAWRDEPSPEWRRAVRLCLRVLRRYATGFPVGVPRYCLHRGDYARLSGAPRLARRHYQHGETAAATLGMPGEAERCRAALAAL